VLSRLLRRAKKALPAEVVGLLGKEAFRTRNRSVRRVAQRLHRIARRKGEKARKELKEAYQKLITITQASCAQAGQVLEALREQADGEAGRLLEHFEHFMALVEQGIDQATRRVLHDEQVPAAKKILSLFEEHTQIITRHKAGKPREFGRVVLIDEVDGGIISRYEILSESGSERSRLPESLRAHQERFGRAPVLLAGDRGLYSTENEKTAQQAGVKRVVLPKSGRLSRERESHEKQRWFRRGFRFRGDRGQDQRAQARLWAGSMFGSRRRRDGEVGGLGHRGPQLKANRPETGRARRLLIMQCMRALRGATRQVLARIYGHFAPKTSTKSEVLGSSSVGRRVLLPCVQTLRWGAWGKGEKPHERRNV
jgi:hypothetical protein